jgi:hypothetical protein
MSPNGYVVSGHDVPEPTIRLRYKAGLKKLFGFCLPLAEFTAVEAAVRDSVRDALLMHQRLGNPVASWKDGAVVWIPPEQIASVASAVTR